MEKYAENTALLLQGASTLLSLKILLLDHSLTSAHTTKHDRLWSKFYHCIRTPCALLSNPSWSQQSNIAVSQNYSATLQS